MNQSESKISKNIRPISAFFAWWGITAIGAILGGVGAEQTIGFVYHDDPLPIILRYLFIGSIPVAVGQLLYLRRVVRKETALNDIQSRVLFWLPASIFLVIVLGLPRFSTFAYSEVWDESKWLVIALNPLTGSLIQGFAMCGILRAKWYSALVWAFVPIAGSVPILGFILAAAVFAGYHHLHYLPPMFYWVTIGTLFGFWQALVFSWLVRRLSKVIPPTAESVPPPRTTGGGEWKRKLIGLDSAIALLIVLLIVGWIVIGQQHEFASLKPDMVPVGKFSIAKYEVTQDQWQSVMGNNSSKNQRGGRYPVENVSWEDVQEFIRQLNQKSAQQYRLPTEEEWYQACHAGGPAQKYCGGENLNELSWWRNNSNGHTHRVGTKEDNRLGIHDMTGNVWEWTSTAESNSYVIRGGSYVTAPGSLGSASRYRYAPVYRDAYIGFRLAQDIE